MNKKKIVVNPFVLCGVVLVLLVLGGSLSVLSQKKTEQVLAKLWQAEEAYNKLDSVALMNDQRVLEADLLDLQKSGSTYVKQRALFLSAMLAYRQGDYQIATDRFLDLSQKFKNGYLAPVAALNAAYGFEQLGSLEKAKQLFEELTKNDKSLVWAEAVFNMARLSESEEEKSVNAYHKLIANLDEANIWRKAAENRLIALNLV